MPTDKKEVILTPFTDPKFRGRGVSVGDIEFQRKFEQNLIRFSLLKSVGQSSRESIPASAPDSSTGGASTAAAESSGCFWTQSGTLLTYLQGNVGIGVAGPTEKLEIDGSIDITGTYKVNGVSLVSTIKLDDLADPDDNADLNVTIYRHGLMSKLPDEAMQLYSGTGAWVEIAAAAGAIHVRSVVSDSARNANSTLRSTASATYVKLKETRIDEPSRGIRIKFTLFTSNAGSLAYGRIYRNGVAIGTERTTIDLFGEVFSEDFDVVWDAADLIQVYVHTEGGATAYVQDLQLCYNRAITGFGSWNLSTGLATVEQTAYAVTSQDP